MKSTISQLGQSPLIDQGDIDFVVTHGLLKLASFLNAERAFWFSLTDDGQYDCGHQYSKGSDELNLMFPPGELTARLMQATDHVTNYNNCICELLIIDNSSHALCQLLSVRNISLFPVFLQGKLKGFISFCGVELSALINSETTFIVETVAQMLGRALLAQAFLRNQNKLASSSDLLEETQKVAAIGGWEFELESQNLLWTKETYRIYGIAEHCKVTPEIGIESYSPEARRIIESAFTDAVEKLMPYELELPFIDKKGQHKWVRTTGKPRRKNGRVTHIYGAFEDITLRKRLLNNDHEIKTNLKIILDNLNDAIVTISENGTILSGNKAVEKIFGYQVEDIIDKDISILMPEPFASSHAQHMAMYLKTGKAGIIGVGRELPALKKDGTEFPMEISISEALEGNSKVFIGIVRDITGKKKNEEHIKKLAFYDRTTQVLNRYSFENDVAASFQMHRQSGSNLIILLVNIDKFSQVNLIYGEKVGDLLLKEFVARLEATIPKDATLYRNNADSFFILLNSEDARLNIDKEICSSNALSERLLHETEYPFNIKRNAISISASIGIIDVSPDDLELADIRPLLELALKKAKDNGGHCVSSAERHEIDLLIRHSQLMIAMKNKHFTDELGLVIQPQFNLHGVVVGSEALVRWNSAEYGLISPAEFIPLAEQNGKIIPIGEWVLVKACELLAQRNRDSVHHSPISVNISAKQFAQPNFCEFLIQTLDTYQVPYNELVLELTESMLISDYDLITSRMIFLKEKGICFSLDDFGTGYSCLSSIQNLPISELKIDKSFVDEIQNEHDEVAIVNTIIQMAKILKLNIVAEGVESSYQLDYLVKQGCKTIQGYLFSKPLNEEKWLALFNSK